VFEKSVKFALDGVLDGFNATVFAYGSTGAGKTYTMLGNEDSYGIMGLTFLELFNKIEE
jgi:kinesin family protein 18/19